MKWRRKGNCISGVILERAMGIEPTSKAWEAYDITQKHAGLAAFLQFSERLNWKIMENGKRAPSLKRRAK
jgi:hypothetical protein